LASATRKVQREFHNQPVKQLTLRSDYYLYWLADTHDLSYAEVGKGRTANGYGIHPDFSSYFGSEIDFVATWAATSHWNLQSGYSHFFVGKYVEESVKLLPEYSGLTDANDSFLMTKFNF
jgi:hypothetical protein